jgi:exosortase A-associated hydrolase 1
MKETAVVFECAGEHLVGVISEPLEVTRRGVLILVGGPQYRIGSHRQFVHIARHLAEAGIAAMRFDIRGMGDSSGDYRELEDINPDIAAALDALQRQVPTLRSVALWGLCGGASAALLYWRATQDPRLKGMALVNPWIRSQVTQARTTVKHYYLKRLAGREFWHKLISGRVARGAALELLRNLRLAWRPGARPVSASGPSDEEIGRQMAEGWSSFPGRLLLVLSENDYTAKQFMEAASLDPLWRRNLQRSTVKRLDLMGADHTFADAAVHATVERATVQLALDMDDGTELVATPSRRSAGSVVGRVATGRG